MINEKDFRLIDPVAFKNKVSLMSKKAKTTIIPSYILKLIVDTALHDILNENQRAKVFLRELFKMKLRESTIARHFKIIKPLLFPNTTVLANSMAFNNQTCRQNEFPSFENIGKLIEYIKSTENKYKWPMLLALYSGIRLKDVIQFKSSHIIMLTKKQSHIPIQRNQEWKVFYTNILEDFVNHLRQKTFKDSCDFYVKTNVDSLVFQNISTASLHSKLLEFYSKANSGKYPPMGFAIPIFRYYASKLETKESTVHGYTNKKNTEMYIKVNVNIYKDRLKAIKKRSVLFSNITLETSSPSSSITKKVLT